MFRSSEDSMYRLEPLDRSQFIGLRGYTRPRNTYEYQKDLWFLQKLIELDAARHLGF